MSDTQNYDMAIIGAGYGGLAVGIQMQRNGYNTIIAESSALPGGVATAFRRKEYIFDGGTHWLAGSAPTVNLYGALNEVLDLSKLTILDPHAFMVIEHAGESLTLYCEIEKLRAEMMRIAPEDKKTIDLFVNAVETAGNLVIPYDIAPETMNVFGKLKFVAKNAAFIKFFVSWKRTSLKQFAQRFTNQTLKELFLRIFPHHDFFSVYAVIATLGWMSKKSGGFPVGGTEAAINVMIDTYTSLGGTLKLRSEVSEIIVEDNCAKGLLLKDGSSILAARTISTADGGFTLRNLLHNKYRHPKIEQLIADDAHTYPGLLQIGVVLKGTFEDMPEKLVIDFPQPLKVGTTEHAEDVMLRACGPQTGLSPEDTTTFICHIRLHDVAYWDTLRKEDRALYKAEKERVAVVVQALIEKRYGQREVLHIDTGSPATYIRYTNSHKASYQGWAPTPAMIGKGISKRVNGLDNFYFGGQWVWPAGGVPGVAIVARHLAQIICKEDKKKFIGL